MVVDGGGEKRYIDGQGCAQQALRFRHVASQRVFLSAAEFGGLCGFCCALFAPRASQESSGQQTQGTQKN